MSQKDEKPNDKKIVLTCEELEQRIDAIFADWGTLEPEKSDESGAKTYLVRFVNRKKK